MTTAATAPTAPIISRILRASLTDFNYWGESEMDSPLTVKRSKGVLDDNKILSLDAAMRKKASGIVDYKAPERRIKTLLLKDVFRPLIDKTLNHIGVVDEYTKAGTLGMEALQTPIQMAEFYIQLFCTFNLLMEPAVRYVEDVGVLKPDGVGGEIRVYDVFTGLFITGKTPDAQTVYASALLMQT